MCNVAHAGSCAGATSALQCIARAAASCQASIPTCGGFRSHVVGQVLSGQAQWGEWFGLSCWTRAQSGCVSGTATACPIASTSPPHAWRLGRVQQQARNASAGALTSSRSAVMTPASTQAYSPVSFTSMVHGRMVVRAMLTALLGRGAGFTSRAPRDASSLTRSEGAAPAPGCGLAQKK